MVNAHMLRSQTRLGILGLALLLAVTGCESKTTETPNPSTFQLTVELYRTAPFGKPDFRPPSDGVLFRNGQRLGKQGESYSLGKDEFLSDAKLFVRHETTCGTEDVPVKVDKSVEQEKAYRQMRIDEWVALQKSKRSVKRKWGARPLPGHTVKTKQPLPKTSRVLAVDNRRGDAAVSVALGKHTEEVPAQKFIVIDRTVGTCESALEVTLNGQKVGVLDWSKRRYAKEKRRAQFAGTPRNDPVGAHQGWLLDATGDGCYVKTVSLYVEKGDGYAYRRPKPVNFKSSAKRRLHETGLIDHFFEAVPTTVKAEGRKSRIWLGDCR
jgi:hypothetical protein